MRCSAEVIPRTLRELTFSANPSDAGTGGTYDIRILPPFAVVRVAPSALDRMTTQVDTAPAHLSSLSRCRGNISVTADMSAASKASTEAIATPLAGAYCSRLTLVSLGSRGQDPNIKAAVDSLQGNPIGAPERAIKMG